MGQIELVLAVLVLAIAFVGAANEPQGGYYQSKYDYVDIEDLLNHKRLVTHYVSCLLGRGPCPPEGADLKRILPEALRTNCLRCTEKQKEAIRMGIKRIRVEYPNMWKELVDAFDPNEQLISKFEASFAQTTSEEDQANLLANRFSEDDAANGLVPQVTSTPVIRPYSGSIPTTTVTTTKTTTTRPLTTRPPTTRPPTTRPPTTRPPTTRPPTTRPPTTTITTTKTPPKPESAPPSFLTIWQIQSSTKPPSYGWRPSDGTTTQNVFFRPFQTIRPLDLSVIKVDSGVQLLGSISDIGNKVLQAGSQVAGMVLSTVQALVGQ